MLYKAMVLMSTIVIAAAKPITNDIYCTNDCITIDQAVETLVQQRDGYIYVDSHDTIKQIAKALYNIGDLSVGGDIYTVKYNVAYVNGYNLHGYNMVTMYNTYGADNTILWIDTYEFYVD